MTTSDFNIGPQYLPGASAGDVNPLDARPRTMFRAPLCTNLDELDADVAFIGMPFDQGTLGRPGARYGPDALRDAPRAYSYLDPFGQGKDAEGFFDADAGDELLRGVTMVDCGNVTVSAADVAHNFARLAGVVERVARRGAMPVILGNYPLTTQVDFAIIWAWKSTRSSSSTTNSPPRMLASII